MRKRINLGHIIRQYRQKKYLSQVELAKKLNTSYQSLQKYEYNKCRPSLETISELIKILEIPYDSIFLSGNGSIKNNIESDQTFNKTIKLLNDHSISYNNLKNYIECKKLISDGKFKQFVKMLSQHPKKARENFIKHFIAIIKIK